MSEAMRRIDPEELRTHVVRLQALARHLLADGARADDVVQDAMVAAIEHPPRSDVAAGPWLVGVVRNLVRRQHRSASRRASHESSAVAPARVLPPDEIAARSEALRDLADAVHRLDPIYRDVIVLRFFDDVRTSAIATRLGVPVETVRTRLKRALALLRERLDEKHGGDGRAWCAALAPLVAGGKAVPMRRLAMKASLAAAALVLVVVTISVVLFGRSDEPPPVTTAVAPPPAEPAAVVENRQTPEPAPAPAIAVAAVAPLPALPVVAAAPAEEPPPVPEPAAPPPSVVEPVGTATLSGAVWFAATRKPAVGQQVVLDATGASAISATTDARGRFRFESLRDDRAWRLRVEAASYAPVFVPNLHLARDETRDLGVLWLDAAEPLPVVVKDWRDRPVAGATVEAERYVMLGISDGWDQSAALRHVTEPVASATTGADGRAVFTTLPPGDWSLVARAPGFAPKREYKVPLVRGAGRRETTIRLDRGTVFEGRIVDGDRRPVSGLVVRALPRAVRLGSWIVQQRSATDDAGRFLFDGLLPGDWEIAAARDGLAPTALALVRVPSSEPIEIVLDGGVVEGFVTDASDGRPLAGARVRARFGIWYAEAVSGEDGRYRLDTMLAARLGHVRVERSGYMTHEEATPHEMSNAPIRWKGAAATRDFALRRCVPLSGRVMSPDGPIAGARVVATWVERLEYANPLLRAEAATDGDGRFTLSGVAPTTVIVQAFADGWYQEGLADFNWSSALINGKRPERAIVVPEGGLADLTISMSRACVVSGRVESAAGAPVAGATVSCSWSSTVTRDDGTFALDVSVIQSSAPVSASAGPGTAVQQTISLSKAGRVDGVVLRLARPMRMSGRVTNDAGAAVDGASVEVVVRLAVPDHGISEWSMARAPVDAAGRYEAELQEREGRIFVRASAPGFASAESAPTPIETGRSTYHADVVLRASRTLAGRVVSSADGRTPVAGARVALLPSDWPVREPVDDKRPRPLAAVTNSDGRFRISDVAAADAYIGVDADGYVRNTSALGVPTSGDLVLKLDPSFEIAGRVTFPNGAVASDVWDGSAIAGVWVMLRLENERESLKSWSVATDAEGRFRATGLPRGTYTVSAHVYGGTISVARFETTGVPSGTTDLAIELQPAERIAGRVLAPDGRPLAGCNVRAYSETGNPYAPLATTRTDGTFVILGIGTGTYRLETRPPEPERSGYVSQGAQLRPSKTTGVAAGAKDVEIRLAGGLSIRGVLFDAAGAPLANAWIRAVARPGQDIEPGDAVWFLGPGAQTDASGRFTISGLANAHYRLIHVPDPQRFDAQPLKGGDDVVGGASGVRLVAGRASRISGVVVDEDGAAIAHASVTARPGGDGPAVFAQSQTDGTFLLDGVSDLAKYDVSVSKAEFLDAQTDDVAPGTRDVRILLVRGLRASGRILQADGKQFANGILTLSLVEGAHRVVVVADAEGRFNAAGLREGTYRAEVRPATTSASTPPSQACGTLRAGDVDIELSITR